MDIKKWNRLQNIKHHNGNPSLKILLSSSSNLKFPIFTLFNILWKKKVLDIPFISDMNNIYEFVHIWRIFITVREFTDGRTDRQTECITIFEHCWKILKTLKPFHKYISCSFKLNPHNMSEIFCGVLLTKFAFVHLNDTC